MKALGVLLPGGQPASGTVLPLKAGKGGIARALSALVHCAQVVVCGCCVIVHGVEVQGEDGGGVDLQSRGRGVASGKRANGLAWCLTAAGHLDRASLRATLLKLCQESRTLGTVHTTFFSATLLLSS